MNEPKTIIRKDREKLQNPYAHLDDENIISANIISASINPYARLANDDFDEIWPIREWHKTVKEPKFFPQNVRSINQITYHVKRKGNQNPYANIQEESDNFTSTPVLTFENVSQGKAQIPFERIEYVARQLAVSLYQNKSYLWDEDLSDDPFKILDPDKALYLLGYEHFEVDSLGELSPGKEVAGLIDKENRIVKTSRRTSYITRRFTLAHEIGHAIMHNQSGLHRDRGIDGGTEIIRDRIEQEAERLKVSVQ